MKFLEQVNGVFVTSFIPLLKFASFPTQMLLIPFSCFTAWAKVFSTMVISSGQSEHLCLVPDHRGKTFGLLPLSMVSSVGFSWMSFILLRKLPSIPSFLSVYHIRMLNFVNSFSASIEIIMGFFFPFILMWYITLTIFSYIESPLHSWDKFHLVSHGYNTYNMVLGLVC